MGEQMIVWMSLALVVTLSGTRAVLEDARPEIAVVAEECTNTTSCFCNAAHALDYALICDVFTSFTLKNATFPPVSVQPGVKELTLNIINDIYEDEIRIPPYLLAEADIEKLTLSCLDNSFYLLVDENSFQALQSTLISVEILGCNLDRLSFAFLSEFSNIERIKFHQTTFPTSSSLESIPALEKWRLLEITSCTGMLEWSSAPSIQSLLELNLEDNLLGDDAVMDILDSVLTYNNDLEVINLKNNSLTEVPVELISSFPSIKSFDLSHNFITHLPRGSLNVSSMNLELVKLDYLSLEKVDSEAFQGYFGSSTITLRHNNLHTFEHAVFRPILDQMEKSEGRIDITGNPIECDCNLEWLIKDHRSLLSHVSGGTCLNSTSFEELNPVEWWTCDTDSLSTIPLDHIVLSENLNIDPLTESSTSGLDLTEEATISSQLITTLDYEINTENAIKSLTSPLPSFSIAEADISQTTRDEVVDYLDAAFTSTPSADYIPEEEMFIFFGPTAPLLTTEATEEHTLNLEVVYSTLSTEAYYMEQIVTTSTIDSALEDITTSQPTIFSLDTEDYSEIESFYSTESPSSSETTMPSFSGDYSTATWNIFSSTPIYRTIDYNSEIGSGEKEEDDYSFRPYPILATKETTTLQPEDNVSTSAEDEIPATTLREMNGSIPTTRDPIMDGTKVKSWLERNPIFGSLIVTWLILLPIALSGIVYICG